VNKIIGKSNHKEQEEECAGTEEYREEMQMESHKWDKQMIEGMYKKIGFV
jgi:hypothetical protein